MKTLLAFMLAAFTDQETKRDYSWVLLALGFFLLVMWRRTPLLTIVAIMGLALGYFLWVIWRSYRGYRFRKVVRNYVIVWGVQNHRITTNEEAVELCTKINKAAGRNPPWRRQKALIFAKLIAKEYEEQLGMDSRKKSLLKTSPRRSVVRERGHMPLTWRGDHNATIKRLLGDETATVKPE